MQRPLWSKHSRRQKNCICHTVTTKKNVILRTAQNDVKKESQNTHVYHTATISRRNICA